MVVERKNYDEITRTFYQTFNEDLRDRVMAKMPKVENIMNFTKNIMTTCKMEKEVVIVALLYLEKLVK